MKIFLISPVRNIPLETYEKVWAYVARLEGAGYSVHWPIRDTKQEDQTGGFVICKTNFAKIIEADEIHVWYDEASGGSKFDMGGVFMLVEMLGVKKKVVIANDDEFSDSAEKTFLNVFRYLT